MMTCFVVVLTAKALSPSMRLIRVATAWTLTGRSRAAVVPSGRGLLQSCLHRPPPPTTPQVMVQFLSAPTRISTSSHQSRRHAKLPRTGVASSSPAGRMELKKKRCSQRRSCTAAAEQEAGGAGEESGGAGEEAGGASTNKSS